MDGSVTSVPLKLVQTNKGLFAEALTRFNRY